MISANDGDAAAQCDMCQAWLIFIVWPPPTPPCFTMGKFDFFKIDGNEGGVWNFLLEKTGLSREIGGRVAILCWDFSNDAA